MQVSHVEEFEQTIENGADRHDGASTRSRNSLPEGDIAVPIKDEADEGVEAVPPTTADFDPIAVAEKIAGHIAEADKADAANREHSMAAGALLLDVQVNHPKHIDAICDRIGLKRSRRAELLMIARGRKTPEQSKAQNKARVKKHRTKKKAAALTPQRPSENPLHRPVMDGPSQPENRGIDVDPDASADAVKMARAAAEAQTEPNSDKPTSKPGKSFRNSKVALAQFKVAVDHWLKQMSADDTTEAIAYAKTIGDRHIAKIREIAA